MRPSWSSKSLAHQAAQGKCPPGQIKMKFEFELKAMEMSVMKDTTYTLKALQSKVCVCMCVYKLMSTSVFFLSLYYNFVVFV